MIKHIWESGDHDSKLIKARRRGKLSSSFSSSTFLVFLYIFSLLLLLLSFIPSILFLLVYSPFFDSFSFLFCTDLKVVELSGELSGHPQMAHGGWGSCVYFHFGHYLLDVPGHVGQCLYDSILACDSADSPVLLWEHKAGEHTVFIWQAQWCTYQ